jgi:hypothetical protein
MNKICHLLLHGVTGALVCATAFTQPSTFMLYPNVPNPFNAAGTEIRYDLPAACFNRIWVEDAETRHVKTLAAGQYLSGYHTIRWDARDENGGVIPSGDYLAKMLSTSGNDTLFQGSITMEAQTTPFPPNVTEIKLTPNDVIGSFYFARAVSSSGDLAVVGARYYDDDIRGTGSAYVYRRVGNVWQLETKLIPSDRRENDNFGYSVSVNGEVILVGAPADIHSYEGPGAVYVYRHDGSRWIEEAKLTPRDAAAINSFGYAVSVMTRFAVVGDPARRFVYMFRHDGSSWTEVSSFGAADEGFGYAVAVNGNAVLIGAPYDDESVVNSGSAYIYRFVGTNWRQEAKLSFEGTSIFYSGGF